MTPARAGASYGGGRQVGMQVEGRKSLRGSSQSDGEAAANHDRRHPFPGARPGPAERPAPGEPIPEDKGLMASVMWVEMEVAASPA